ncbi:hypothetical protein EZV62_003840 [Acer yangbiense]|uniref:Uncharacterized protein n=1 Tax=Acer yangbiense TaxID=1000413 RepID=A0A5C7III9_9ROSI|nr:hypothetical protein EZV62_003840 [Acer yangbiense]
MPSEKLLNMLSKVDAIRETLDNAEQKMRAGVIWGVEIEKPCISGSICQYTKVCVGTESCSKKFNLLQTTRLTRGHGMLTSETLTIVGDSSTDAKQDCEIEKLNERDCEPFRCVAVIQVAARGIYEDLMAIGYIDPTKSIDNITLSLLRKLKLLEIHLEHKWHLSDLSFIAWNAMLNCQQQGTWLQNNYELDEAGGRTGQRDDPMDNLGCY